jgi:hypothetical protein
METMQITLTPGLRDFLQTQATKRGFASPKDYLQSLLVEWEQRVNEKKELEASLLDAVCSPEIVADAAFWAERRRKILEKRPGLE